MRSHIIRNDVKNNSKQKPIYCLKVIELETISYYGLLMMSNTFQNAFPIDLLPDEIKILILWF